MQESRVVGGAGTAVVVTLIELLVVLAILGRPLALYSLLPATAAAVVLATAFTNLRLYDGPSARSALRLSIWVLILSLLLFAGVVAVSAHRGPETGLNYPLWTEWGLVTLQGTITFGAGRLLKELE